MKKSLVIIGAVVAVAAGITAASFLGGNSVTSIEQPEQWSTYSNADAGYSFAYPPGWQAVEYVNPDGTIAAAAFDPEYVATQEEYNTLDAPPGRVWVYTTDGMPDSGGVAATIGDTIDARLFAMQEDENGPNAAWHNRTDRRYFVALPQATGVNNVVVVAVQYVNALEEDSVTQAEINQILASFRVE